jgi:hypothetical protein
MKFQVVKSIMVLPCDATIDGKKMTLIALDVEAYGDTTKRDPIAFSITKGRELANLILETCDEWSFS